jgi:hypothetical protein
MEKTAMRLLYSACLILLSLIILTGSASGQISEGGTPPSFNKLSLSAVPEVSTSPIDVQALMAEDAIQAKNGLPFRFGKPFDVDYSLENSGVWDDLPDGGRIWRLEVYCPGAFSINLLYSRYRLPAGAKLFLYNQSRDMVIGAFTSRNNKADGKFATAPIKGDITIVEYYEPAEAVGMGELTISRIVHGYKDVFFNAAKDAEDFGDAGVCNNNINCPVGADWQNDKRAVAMILTSGGFRLCTGALVNNVRQDATPYFLTANHCLGGQSSWIFMFNYESPSCDNIDGPTDYTVQGSVLRATYEASDFALLELTEQPPDSYNVYFAGWSNVDTPSQSSTCIHHPSGDIKKISFDYDPVTSTDYLASSGTSHWRIGSWDDGTTEPGSSGSPLFDQNHRVVGQLHGGYASCSSLTSDWFGKFAMSWNGGGSASSRLRDWLDPDSTGTTVLDGYDPNAGVAIQHVPLENTYDTLNDYEVVCYITSNAALDPGQLELHYYLPTTWYTEPLQATGGPDEYHAYIPAQTAGTTVEYYLTAADGNGSVDTTETYSFFVEYSAGIAVSPISMSPTVILGESDVEDLIIENVGNGPLDYAIGVFQSLKDNFVFGDLLAAGLVEPARRFYPDKYYNMAEAKGETAPLQGYTTDKGAGGPDGFGYVWIDSDQNGGPAYNWIDISGVGSEITGGLGDDNFVGPLPIGFDFIYYGNTYTEFYVGSNGIVGFSPDSMKARLRTPLPDTAAPNDIMAWLWDDLDITDSDNPGGHVYYHSDGSQLVIQFVDYPEYRGDPGDVVTAEVILNSDGSIQYQYQNIAAGFDVMNCTVGIENAGGTDGLQVAYLAAYLHSNLAIEFYTPYQWLSTDPLSGTIPPGGADTVHCAFTTAELDTGVYNAQIIIQNNDPDPGDNPQIVSAQMTVINSQYVCGDADGDSALNIGDAVHLVNYIFKGGPAPEPLCVGDPNHDTDINIGDVVYLINYIFKGGPPPVEPCCP